MADLTTQIRGILRKYSRLTVDVDALHENSDLYAAGLTSLATVSVMLALEEHFNIEFRESMLSRKTFGSLESIVDAVAELTHSSPPLALST